MSTTFSCPECNRTFRTSRDVHGEIVACPGCKVEIEVPNSSTATSRQVEPDLNLVPTIQSCAKSALILAILALLGFGVALTAIMSAPEDPGPYGRSIRGMYESQGERHKREAIVLGGALCGIVLGLGAIRRGSRAVSMITNSGLCLGDKSRATIGMYAGMGAIAANGVALLAGL